MEFWKKTPAQQASGPFALPAIPSAAPTEEDWQGAIAAAEAAAVCDVHIAQQLRDDAAEAQRLQDIYDLLGPGQSAGDDNLPMGPFDLPSPPANVWGPGYPILHSPSPNIFHFGRRFAAQQPPPPLDLPSFGHGLATLRQPP